MEKEKIKKKPVKEKKTVDSIINNPKYPEIVKDNLNSLSVQLSKIVKYKYNFPNIIVDNSNKKELAMYKEALIDLLKLYDSSVNIAIYDEDTRIRDFKDNSNVLVIDDIEYFISCEEYGFKKCLDRIKKGKLSIILLTEKAFFPELVNADTKTNYYRFLNELSISFMLQINSCLHTTTEIYKEIVNELENRDIILKIPEDKMRYLINHLLTTDEDYTNAGCASSMIEDFTKLCIVNDTDTILEDDALVLYGIEFDKMNETEPKKNGDTKTTIEKMIGLDSVKEEIANLKNYLTFINTLEHKPEKTFLNMFFLGNPGTGKTTIARMFKDVLFDLGYIKENKIVEIVPNDLVGQHVGETRFEARKVLDKAKGGVLFIDEAYLLYTDTYYRNGQNPFMEEAVVELMKYLEDPTNVVIFAGYPKELRDVYKANPGLRSRIFKEIEFPDYTNQELYKILVSKLKEYDLKIAKTAKKNIISLFDIKRKTNTFGNARYVEKLAQVLINNHANRKLNQENYLIEELDIPKIEDNGLNKRIGFVGE